ncbi:hypothetical protein Ddye_010828 [Dipteronia dyeriana]|uniref:RNase H type-1 domain-containing protein n=1 Tax=Dipteronia dyeriana TaxID=168575 RepID=A0AAE0CNM7_9ROSI|nr:hypothetical protein Ddye_010828 [Dipteronia dyeriana]
MSGYRVGMKLLSVPDVKSFVLNNLWPKIWWLKVPLEVKILSGGIPITGSQQWTISLREISSVGLKDFFSSCCERLKQEDVEILSNMLWRVWFERNCKVHNKGEPSMFGSVYEWSVDYLGRVGIIARDFQGLVLGASSQKIMASYDPLIAEAVAMLRGIVFAFYSGLVPFVIETYSLGVVDLMTDGRQVSGVLRILGLLLETS